jgi:endoglycosylceramidase
MGTARRGRSITLLAVTAALLLAAPAPPATAAVQGSLPSDVTGWTTTVGTDGRVYLADTQGRARQLHGANHKTDDPDTLTDQLLAAAAERGLDHIRLAIYWDTLEPSPGVYDAAYLAKVTAALDRAEAHGLLVILDMHQDVFGPAFGFKGIPVWATRTDGAPYVQQPVWLLNYLQPAVQNAFEHLYEDADLRQAQIDVWVHVVEAVKDHPAVLGYDLLNEPFGKLRPGEDLATAAARVEREQMTPMFQRLTDAISAVDPHHWVLFEAPNLASIGVPSSLGQVTGPKVAFYPHMYDPAIEAATYTPGGTIAYNPEFFGVWAGAITPYTAAHPMPMLVGEWGIAHPEAGGMDAFVRDSLATLDRVSSGWSVFNWCMGDGYCPIDANGDDRPNISQIFAPYARAIAGAPTSSVWDPTTAELRVEFADNAATGATEIFVPESRSYPGGFRVEASDASFTQTFDAGTGVLSVTTPDTGGAHAICVKPTSAPVGCALPVVVPTTSTTTAGGTGTPTGSGAGTGTASPVVATPRFTG